MRLACVSAILGLTACGGLGDNQSAGRHQVERAAVSTAFEHASPVETSEAAPFSGEWESCQAAASADECSRYVLVQSGQRICGTWSYVATGQSYEGKLIAKAASATSAIHTHVCGRIGSETNTECTDGWQETDKTLDLCGENLSDIKRTDGTCMADYVRVSTRAADELFNEQPWLLGCVSETP